MPRASPPVTPPATRRPRARPPCRRRCRPRRSEALLVPRHRRQPVQVLQQDAAALQVENAVLAPELQLTVDAFAGGADEDAELFLRDVHFGTEIGGKCAEPPRE